ncbi:MAG: hypothetical protein Q8930_16930 [Bacillota bacterium]|nr:hypothetical protein [Bacillota bacterium]
MTVGLAVVILVIIAGCVYLYYDNKKLGQSDVPEGAGGSSVIILLSAAAGGFLAFLLLIVLQSVFDTDEISAVIVAATITLSTIICGCTGWIVKTIKELNVNKKEL